MPNVPKSIARRGEALEVTCRAKYNHGNASCGTPRVSSQLLESPVPAAPPAALLALLAVTRSPAEEMWAGKHGALPSISSSPKEPSVNNVHRAMPVNT